MTRRRQLDRDERALLFDDDGLATCHYCGTTTATEVDHVIPFSRGGSEGLSNMVPACDRCNREKQDRTPSEWRADRDGEMFEVAYLIRDAILAPAEVTR